MATTQLTFPPKPLSSPFIVFTASGKGGVGKTLNALAIADGCEVNDKPLHIIQFDQQARLAQSLGKNVETVVSPRLEARRDAAALLRTFTPIHASAERAAKTGTNVLIDFGPNEVIHAVTWLGMAEMAEEFREMGIGQAVVVPAVAEPESLRQAHITLTSFQRVLPDAHLVFVENQRDGAFRHLHPSSEAARILREDLEPLSERTTRLVMPMIDAGSWRPFEAACQRFIDVIAMDVATIMQLTGLPRPEARIVRGDIAAFLAQYEKELAKVFGFSAEEAE